MVTILINNNKCRLVGNRKVLNKIHKAFKIRNPNAFFIRKMGNVQQNWDGKINYITESDYFKTGLLTKVYKWLEAEGVDIEVIDHRPDFNVIPKAPKKLGAFELTGNRKYQRDAIKAIIHNSIGNVSVPTGVIDAATNAGKTAMMAGIYIAYQRKIPALVLLKDGDLFEQFKKEIPELIGHEDFGFVRGKEQNWNKFTICMVQTLSRDIKKHKRELVKFGIVLVDEADEADSKSYKTILTNMYNTVVRVGLSGSIFMSKLAKDKPKNENLRSFFGEVVFKITKKEMTEKGLSTPVIVKIHKGSNYKPVPGDFQVEYRENITNNKDRAKVGLDLLKRNIRFNRLPALIICRFHAHIELLYNIYNEELGDKYVVKYVHGGIHSKIRKEILEDFRVGKIDILISSFIIKRGKNHPLIKYIQNAAASDSQETISQIMGRGERVHKNKKKYYLDDFFDEGQYLKRHSKHRIIYYKNEKFKVILKF
jgi:ATP-dependent helicase IRC3